MEVKEMATRTAPSGRADFDVEKNAELVGVLTAISIVSKRLAGRLMALERKQTEKPKGGSPYVKNRRTITSD
jgi:hypothetical protein